GVVGQAWRKPRVYASRIAFRVSENELDVDSAPKTNGRLREYVWQVAFSNTNLLRIIKEEKLYPSLFVRDPSLPVEEMRDDLEVEVWRNYFGQRRTAEEPTLSARLAVTYRGRDREKVFAVVQRLGRLIVEQEQSARVEQADVALRLADDEVDSARLL